MPSKRKWEEGKMVGLTIQLKAGARDLLGDVSAQARLDRGKEISKGAIIRALVMAFLRGECIPSELGDINIEAARKMYEARQSRDTA